MSEKTKKTKKPSEVVRPNRFGWHAGDVRIIEQPKEEKGKSSG